MAAGQAWRCALAALAMVAWGRALGTDPWAPITSRHIMLSSVAWALLGWIGLERILVRTALGSLVLAATGAGLLRGRLRPDKPGRCTTAKQIDTPV